VIGIESDHDLMNSKFGKYGEMNTGFTGEDVRGIQQNIWKPNFNLAQSESNRKPDKLFQMTKIAYS
jgi:CRISPR/Cas system type I-B associated protein Csh2 (Cas7 group RAMP superfamily)